MGRPIDLERKGVSHPFMIMILTSETMVGWADVPDSDFRLRRAVNIFSLHKLLHLIPLTHTMTQVKHQGLAIVSGLHCHCMSMEDIHQMTFMWLEIVYKWWLL